MKLLITILTILVTLSLLGVNNSFAASTISQYCQDGKCSTISPGTITSKTTDGIHINNSNLIGLQVEPVCTTMWKHNITSGCLSYKILKVFDTTNPRVAGMWVDTPYYHRLPPKMTNMYNFFNTPLSIMVDPDPLFASRAKMITVKSHNFTWTNPDDISKGGLQTIIHVNRYVSNCQDAEVAPNLFIINDTINYLKSGCKTTLYNDTQITYHKAIAFDYNNPFSTLLQTKFLNTLLHNHSSNSNHTSGGFGPGNCQTGQCSFTDPYAKVGYR